MAKSSLDFDIPQTLRGALQQFFSTITTLPHYPCSGLRADLIAGLAI